MKNTRIYKIAFIIMLIINGLLVFLLVQRPPFMPHGKQELLGKISTELGLTPEQKEKYSELAKAHRISITKIEHQQKALVKSYFQLLKSNSNPDSEEALLNQIQEVERSKLTLTFQHFEQLKALCTEEQKDRFELIIDDILKVLIGQTKKSPPPPRD